MFSPTASSPYSPFFTSGLLSDDPLPSAGLYFTLQQRRDYNELRSFLSLDLAESLSLRSPRKSAKIAPRDDFRTIPSPKPAPNATLPNLPASPRPSHALAHHPSLSTPSLFSTSNVPNPRMSRISMSTVSTHYRRVKRSDALAKLEGRAVPTRAYAGTPMAIRNFMSMSDDEDDALDERDDEGFEDGALSSDEEVQEAVVLDKDIDQLDASDPQLFDEPALPFSSHRRSCRSYLIFPSPPSSPMKPEMSLFAASMPSLPVPAADHSSLSLSSLSTPMHHSPIPSTPSSLSETSLHKGPSHAYHPYTLHKPHDLDTVPAHTFAGDKPAPPPTTAPPSRSTKSARPKKHKTKPLISVSPLNIPIPLSIAMQVPMKSFIDF